MILQTDYMIKKKETKKEKDLKEVFHTFTDDVGGKPHGTHSIQRRVHSRQTHLQNKISKG